MKSKITHNAIAIFRDYTSTVYSFRQKNSDMLAISTGYPIENTLKMSIDMLKALAPLKNDREINRLGYGWNFDGAGLKSTIAFYENTKNNTTFYTTNCISLTLGGTHGLNQICLYLSKTNNYKRYSIIVLGPTFFRLFADIINYADIIPVIGEDKNNFIPTFEDIFSSIKKNTIAIFLCNPSNPVYKFFPIKLLDRIIIEANKRGIFIIIDEVGDTYRFAEGESYAYSTRIHLPNVVRICSASKTYLMAEYRLGYVITNPEIALEISRMVSNYVSHINYSACEGWKIGLNNESKRLNTPRNNSLYSINRKENMSILNEARNFVFATLKSSSKVNNILLPDACFSLIFQIHATKFENDVIFYKNLLNSTGVSIVPGSGFGIKTKDMWFRLTFAYPMNKLKIALNKITDFIQSS